MDRLRIAVIFGSPSPEHEVSLASSYNVIKSLKDSNFVVYPIGITKKGSWHYYYGDIEKIKNGEWEKENNCKAFISPDSSYKGIIKVEPNGKFSIFSVDCVFAVVHGDYGEDGKLSGLFDMAKIPYVGCDVLASSCCINKIISHIIFEYNGIKSTKWKALKKEDLKNIDFIVDEISLKLSFPIFTKPASCGSSVGISKCRDKNELMKGIKFAFEYDDEILCEAYIKGREVECAVIGPNDSPKASIVGQIDSFNDFYDYEAKYKLEPHLIIPAKLDENISEKIRNIAVKAYKAIGCSGLSRVDFFVDEENEIYLNEINTMPGFTNSSMYTKLWEKSGLEYKKILEILINIAIEKCK